MFKKLCHHLSDKKLSLFFIESASAGYLSYKFSLSPFSGDILKGGLVCYDLKIKEKFLKIPPNIIKKHTAESKKVTQKLITYSKKKFNADIYISCTGLLKPGGSENNKKPVGTFFYCIYYNNKIYSYKKIYKGKPEKKLRKLLNDICNHLIKITQ